jgi:membrane protein DedA with SNARE-associated domain
LRPPAALGRSPIAAAPTAVDIDNFEAGMDVVPLLTLAAILFIKEAGLPVPVPGDLLVVGAGVSTSGRSDAIAWLVAVLTAGYAGGAFSSC